MPWELRLEEVYQYTLEGSEERYKNEWRSKLYTPDKACLQIGVFSGWHEKYGPNWTSMDKYDTRPCIDHNVDICVKEECSKFENHFDLIECNAILEHVKQPFHAAENLILMLKQGGILYAEVPFIQPYHPHGKYQESEGMLVEGVDCDHPHGGDYWRFTPQGIRQLFINLELIDLRLINEGGILFIGRKP